MRLSVKQEAQSYLRSKLTIPKRVKREKPPKEYAAQVDAWLARSFFVLLFSGIVGITWLTANVSLWMLLIIIPWAIVLFMIVDFANYFESRVAHETKKE